MDSENKVFIDIFGDEVPLGATTVKLIKSFVSLKEYGTEKRWKQETQGFKVSWSENSFLILEIRELGIGGYLLYVFAPDIF